MDRSTGEPEQFKWVEAIQLTFDLYIHKPTRGGFSLVHPLPLSALLSTLYWKIQSIVLANSTLQLPWATLNKLHIRPS